MQYYFGGHEIAYRNTPHGKEVLAVGSEGREEQDGAAAIDGPEALHDGPRRSCACDHVVRRKAVVGFPHLRGNVVSAVNDDVGPAFWAAVSATRRYPS